MKGAWDGQFSDILELPRGLGPKSIGGLVFEGDTADGKANIVVKDGRLVVGYSEGPVSVSVGDDQAWQANFSKADFQVHVKGHAWDEIDWDMAKNAAVAGLGTVGINVSSDKSFGIAVVPELSQLMGFDIKAVASSHGEDVKGRLDAQRALTDQVNLSYSLENDEGQYKLEDLKHKAIVNAKLDDFSAALVRLESSKDAKVYNLTLRRDLTGFFKSKEKAQAVKADAVLGADSQGVYAALYGARPLKNGLSASYQASARGLSKEVEPVLSYSGTLAHELGTLTVSRSSGEPLEMKLESKVTDGPLAASGKLSQTLARDAAPSFNVTVSRDMADVLPGTEIMLGVDSASLDGVYGKIAGSWAAGDEAKIEYSSIGRVTDMAHTLKVSNDLGYAKLVKAGDAAPRLQLGYQFEA